MKKILSLLLTLASVSAAAFHPGDEERLVRIGVGTKLKVLRDINIVPSKTVASLGGSCYLSLREAKNYDRVLVADTILSITKTDSKQGPWGYEAAIFVDNNNIESIFCSSRDRRPTIGDLKNGTKDTLEVKLADPTRI